VTVQESLEQTAAGVRFKSPKTKKGRRTISIPAATVAALRSDFKAHAALLEKLQLNRDPRDDLVFPGNPETDDPRVPGHVTKSWSHIAQMVGIDATLHSLRHTHASQLIAAGMDVVAVSRRLGHSAASITLDIYSHLFKPGDSEAVAVLDAAYATPAPAPAPIEHAPA